MPLMKRETVTSPVATPPSKEAVAILTDVHTRLEAQTGVEQKAEAPKYTGRKASSDTMSKDEWAAKDRRISRAGLYQAALQSVGAVQFCASTSLEDYLKVVRRVAEDGLEFVNEAAK